MRRIPLLFLLPLLLICGCRKNQVEMPNPIVESSFEEIQQKLGITFGIPKDAENIYYSIIAGESDGEITGIVIWQDIVPGLTYSVSMKQNATLENLFILANAVFIPLQGDS